MQETKVPVSECGVRVQELRILGRVPEVLVDRVERDLHLQAIATPEGATRELTSLSELVSWAADRRQVHAGVVVLTDRPLRTRECASMFGYTDRNQGVALVSTARLQDPTTPDLLTDRVRKVLAHERGHLEGLRHCLTPSCAMFPVREAEDLDRRNLEPCGGCPTMSETTGRRLRSLLVFAVLLLLALGLGWGISQFIGPAFEMPFT